MIKRQQALQSARIVLAALVMAISATLFAPSVFSAFANSTPDSLDTRLCKDCPFPMRVGENRWKMPSGYVEIEILKKRLPNRLEEIQVRLIDSRDGRILATGTNTQRRGRKTIDIEMIDLGGSPVHGYVRYLGETERNIQVRFTCDNCTIAGDLH